MASSTKRKAWDHSGDKTTTERGYGYAWRKLRATILKRDKGLCQPCRAKGTFTQATAVDHIKPKAKGGTDAPRNLQSICDPCHEAKTITDAGAAQNQRMAFDANGFPVW